MRRGAILALAVAVCPALALAQNMQVARPAPPPLEFSGFIDLAYGLDTTFRSSSFALSEVEIDLKKSFADIASFRVDLNFRFADALDPTGKIMAPDYDKLLEQAFVTIDVLKKKTGLSLTVGKFNAPIGFESLDPPDRYQISLSNVFSLLLPFNVLGAMMSWERGPVTVIAHVTKGWDLLVDNNSSQTFGARVALALAGGKAVLGLSGLWGPEGPRDGDARTVVDLDFTLRLWDKLVWGLEVNVGSQENASTVQPGNRATWVGFLNTLHWRWREWLGTTLRYDVIHDPQGGILPGAAAQTLQSVTTAALFTLSQGNAPFGVATGALAGIEYRADFSDAPVFPRADGTAAGTRHTLAAKLLYAW
jgi:hypothetical protein